jgi:hypothetical protein
MLPGRDDIALPPFAPGVSWIGGEPPVGERLTARGPLLVHFFEIGELSGVRTLPFVTGMARQYGAQGLTVLGVHSPRSALAESDEALAAGLARLGVDFPVANDREHRIWHGYGCEGWPSTFLWGRGGKLRWVHFGEGAYHETEEAIRAQIGGDPGDMPPPLLDPPREEPAPALEPPSPELFPGGAHDRPWQAAAPGDPLEAFYAGAGAWVALDGTGTVALELDGEPAGTIELEGPGLYELSSHDRHGEHELRLTPEGPVRVWSLAFAPGAAQA